MAHSLSLPSSCCTFAPPNQDPQGWTASVSSKRVYALLSPSCFLINFYLHIESSENYGQSAFLSWSIAVSLFCPGLSHLNINVVPSALVGSTSWFLQSIESHSQRCSSVSTLAAECAWFVAKVLVDLGWLHAWIYTKSKLGDSPFCDVCSYPGHIPLLPLMIAFLHVHLLQKRVDSVNLVSS